MEYSLDILGSEWIIIVFVVLMAILGTNKLPEVTRKMGRAMGEYNKATNEIRRNLNGIYDNLNVTGPVQNERQKLEFMAKSLEIDFTGKTDEQLKKLIASRLSADTPQKD